MYLEWLEKYAESGGCVVHAYAPMTNHVHLLLTAKTTGGVGQLIKRLGQGSATDWHECALTGNSDLIEKELAKVLQRITTAIRVSVIADKRRLESDFRHAFKGVEAISQID
ncbi:transposase [Salinisphaera sp. LB1]|uniref:transposase n=1 Tax=Salinisphaera sp. LB1 TaxID=2183911 RepID=UPI000D7076CD